MAPTNNNSAPVGASQGISLIEIGRKICESAQKIDDSWPSASIYRVPKELRMLKTSAYTPRLVSIGPLHCKDEHLMSSQHMQDIKRYYVHSLFNRKTGGSEEDRGLLLTNCLEKMRESIEEANKYYAEKVDVELNEEMLLIDGCFILEVLCRYYDRKTYEENSHEESSDQKVNNQTSSDPIFDCVLTRVTVQHDLLLLENQLPFFVLKKLFDLTLNHPSSPSLDHFVVTYFRSVMSSENHNPKNGSSPRDCVLSVCCGKTNYHDSVLSVCCGKTNYHILHLLHNHYLPDKGQSCALSVCCGLPCKPKDKKRKDKEQMPSASHLDYAGVKFVARTGEDLFNVEFTPRPYWSCRRARFEIPKFRINDSTEPLLRNLIAFEQCCPRLPCYFTSYAVLMNELIDTEKDVQVLKKAEIIRNDLGTNEDACDLFNHLCQEIALGDFYFAETCHKAALYSNRSWPNFMAHLRRKYFASPWSFITFCVAIIVFGMSVTSFVRSFL